ncbi:MAG TPA: hypothetical protein VGF43_05205 [Dongiaceae bacterium]|jgi:hypothetical protein
MKLRLDLVLAAVLVATAGSELVAPDALYAAERADQVCQASDQNDGRERTDAEKRIVAEGYTDVRMLGKSCDNDWHAIALADGDPVDVRVTPQGTVLTE